MDVRIDLSTPAALRGFATSYRPERGLVEMTEAGPGFAVPATAVSLRIESAPERFAGPSVLLSIECEVAGKPAALRLDLSAEDAGALAEALPPAEGAELRWEARFNGGQGGATIEWGGRSTFLTGRPARQLAAALDPGRASRPFAAEIERKSAEIAAELRGLAGDARLGRAFDLADRAEALAARAEALGVARPAGCC